MPRAPCPDGCSLSRSFQKQQFIMRNRPYPGSSAQARVRLDKQNSRLPSIRSLRRQWVAVPAVRWPDIYAESSLPVQRHSLSRGSPAASTALAASLFTAIDKPGAAAEDLARPQRLGPYGLCDSTRPTFVRSTGTHGLHAASHAHLGLGVAGDSRATSRLA